MKRAALSLILSFAVAGSLYAAEAQSPQSPPAAPAAAQAPSPQSPAGVQANQDKTTDITVTGCLIQGSAPNVFVLEDAKMSTGAPGDKGKSYLVVVSGAADLKPHLNHQVRIVGAETASVNVAPAPSGQARIELKTDEASLPRLNARTVTMVANTCPA
jgi:hypothetical protein